MDFGRNPEDIVKDLRVKHYVLPDWHGKLELEYDPKKHPIFTDVNYLDNPSKKVKLCRVACGWQKLATKRMSELIFGIQAKRVWRVDTDEHRRAAKLIEGIFAKNRIDSVNLDRAKKLYCSCQFTTIWYNQVADTVYGGEKSYHKIRCKTYSPKDGDNLYPLFDEYDDLIALSIEYARTVGDVTTTYFETFTANMHMRWRKDEQGWAEDMAAEKVKIGKIAGVYMKRDEPIWEDESNNVYEVEWSLSRNGNYIKKNSKPNWVVRCDKSELENFRREEDTDTTSRNVLYYPENAKVGFETWQQSVDALKFQNETIRRNFFMQLQLPDMSFESMKTTPMSGESRKMMFIDSELKVLDESGAWIDTLYRECMVVKEFAKLAVPSLASAIDSLELEEIIITPYRIRDDNEKITNLTTATGGKAVMSQRTAIAKLGEVDDVDEEIKQINQEEAASLEEMAF